MPTDRVHSNSSWTRETATWPYSYRTKLATTLAIDTKGFKSKTGFAVEIDTSVKIGKVDQFELAGIPVKNCEPVFPVRSISFKSEPRTDSK